MKTAGLFAAAGLAAAAFAASASAGSTGSNGCLGSAVSANAHYSQQVLGAGQGRVAHDGGFNIGQSIQDYHAAFCR